MHNRPFSCPQCNTFVRHDWVDDCGVCGAPLVAAPVFEQRDAEPIGTHKKSGWPAIVAVVLVAGVVLVGGSVAAFGMNPGEAKNVASDKTATSDPVTTLAPIATLAPKVPVTHATMPSKTTLLPPVSLDNWVNFTDAGRRFSASFPSKPAVQSETRDGITIEMYSCGEQTGAAVLVTPVLAGVSSQKYVDAVSAVMVPSDAQLISRDSGEATGFTFTDIVMKQDGVITKLRIMGTDKQVYVITVAVEDGQDFKAPFEKLSSSFTVLSNG